MRIVYEALEGTNYPWIEEEIQKTLKWVTEFDFGPDFWSRVTDDLRELWERLAVALINCVKPVYGFTYLVTNSALTVYPQV